MNLGAFIHGGKFVFELGVNLFSYKETEGLASLYPRRKICWVFVGFVHRGNVGHNPKLSEGQDFTGLAFRVGRTQVNFLSQGVY